MIHGYVLFDVCVLYFTQHGRVNDICHEDCDQKELLAVSSAGVTCEVTLVRGDGLQKQRCRSWEGKV